MTDTFFQAVKEEQLNSSSWFWHYGSSALSILFSYLIIPSNFEIKFMVTYDKYILWIFPLDWLKT